jgi:uncharacterized protein
MNAEHSPSSNASPLLTKCLQALREREMELRARGILHAGIFGSVARGNDDEKSDVDVIVDVRHGAELGILGILRLRNELTQVFGRSVDVISRDALQSLKHDRVLMDMVAAF